MNYAQNRQIKNDRVYKTLGKVTPLRIVLGVALLMLALLISGNFSQLLAGSGCFRAAQALMIAPGWMEKYKPEQKAYIQAGVLYQDGDYEGACEAFAAIDGDAAAVMRNAACVKLASRALEEGDEAGSFAEIERIDGSGVPSDVSQEYLDVCNALYAYYSAGSDPGSAARAETLGQLIAAG